MIGTCRDGDRRMPLFTTEDCYLSFPSGILTVTANVPGLVRIPYFTDFSEAYRLLSPRHG